MCSASFGLNQMILAQTVVELSSGQAQNWVKFDFRVKLTLKFKVNQHQKE